MKQHELSIIRKDWEPEFQWSIRYLEIYDLPNGLAENLIENIIKSIMEDYEYEYSVVYGKEIFLRKLRQTIAKLKLRDYAA